MSDATTRIFGMLKAAANEVGQTRLALLSNFLFRRPLGSGMLLSEYLSLGLHETSKILSEQSRCYIGAFMSYKISNVLNPVSAKRAVLGDKVLFGATMKGFGLPVPGNPPIFNGVFQ